MQARK